MPLPARAEEALRAHLTRVRDLHASDLAAGLGAVWVPEALARQFPSAPKDWRWQSLFPSGRTSAHQWPYRYPAPTGCSLRNGFPHRHRLTSQSLSLVVPRT